MDTHTHTHTHSHTHMRVTNVDEHLTHVTVVIMSNERNHIVQMCMNVVSSLDKKGFIQVIQ